jgi:hypothetical protein
VLLKNSTFILINTSCGCFSTWVTSKIPLDWLTSRIPRVPKELISRFVKLCPTCRVRRGTARTSPTVSDKDSVSDYMDIQSPPEMLSPHESRRSDIGGRQGSLSSGAQVQQATYSSAFQSQNRWMSSAPQAQSYTGPANVLIPAPSHSLASNAPAPARYSTGNVQPTEGRQTGMGTAYFGNQASARHQTY